MSSEDTTDKSSTDAGPSSPSQIHAKNTELECQNCEFRAARRDEFGTYGKAMSCPECGSLRVEHVFTEDSAGTCESCGDDVEADRLIEGECPGCHYRLIADGDQDVVTIEREHAETLLEAAGTLRDDIASERQWGTDDEASRENAGELEDAFQALQDELRPPSNDDEELVADGGTTWYDLHAFKRDILRVLAEMADEGVEMYGLELKRRLEDRYGKEVNHGRLYPNLDELVTLGLIEKGRLDKRTNSYRLTEPARAMLRRQREAFVELPVKKPAVADGGEK